MSTLNPFDLLGDDDNDDPSQLIAAAQKQKVAAAAAAAAAAASTIAKKSPAAASVAKMPSKPDPPSQAVKEARNAPSRGGFGRGGSRGSRGGRFQNRDFGSRNENGFSGNYGSGDIIEEGNGKPSERSEGYGGPPRQLFRGGRSSEYGGDADGDAKNDTERPPRRTYERRSGTGRGYEMKREGAGRANWGNVNDDVLAAQDLSENVNADEKVAAVEKHAPQENGSAVEVGNDNKENVSKAEEKLEEKEMTLEEYEKIREEKRKALLVLKAEERKVTIDKELESMQLLSVKKENDEIFAKLGSNKESKKKEAEREEKAKKSLTIQEFLKPAEGERNYGRGRGRGRSDLGGRGGGRGGGRVNAPPPAIEDNYQFPTLGCKN